MTWMMTRLIRAVGTRWITFGALAIMFAIAGYSLGEAEWVRDTFYVHGLWLGALCGAALAVARWRGRSASLYCFTLSLLVAAEFAGRAIPAPLAWWTLPYADNVWTLHVRTLTLLDRAREWAALIVNGDRVNDNGLFIALVTLALWNAGAWLTWRLIRERRALDGLIPLGVLLALNNQLSGRSYQEFTLFLACAILLVARAGFTYQQHHWLKRKVDYAESAEFDWMLNALPIALALSGIVFIAPFVGTPQGWDTLADLFRTAQQQTADTAARWFADVRPPLSADPLASARTPDLTRIGRPLPQGTEPLLWVRLSDPPPLPPEANLPGAITRQHYWRSQIFATYTGAGWEPVTFSDETLEVEAAPDAPPGRYRLDQHFEIVAAHGDAIFGVNAPISASAGIQLRALPAGLDALLLGTVSTYDVASWAADTSIPQLTDAPAGYPPEINAVYLQVPVSFPSRVRQLAVRLTEGAPTPYAKAVSIQNYLRQNYPYTLDVPAPPGDQDAVDYFLFDAPGGFCSYYASAMTVMLRVAGVPARVVTGYAMGAYDYERRAYRVTGNDAHAWVEVFFPGYGWAEFEPTAARAPFEYRAEVATPAPVTPVNVAPETRAGLEMSGWAWIGLGLIVLFLVWPLLTRGRTTDHTPRGEARELYWAIRRSLARIGLRAPPSTTPDEFLAVHSPVLAERPALRNALTQATALYEHAIYSPHPLTLRETLSAQELWRRAWGERVKIWGNGMGLQIKRRRQ